MVGVPKTIDNDLNGTDYTFGFDTAVYVATEAIDRVHSTAESHNRIIVVETMGRHAGWIALMSGIAGGADYILIPEQPVVYDDVAAAVERRRARGKNFSVVVASEGAELPGVADEGEVDDFGHVRVENRAVGETVAQEVESRTGMQARATVLGYIQRGGTPTPRDRVLGLRFGLEAADLVHGGHLGPDGGAARRRRRLGAAHGGDGRAQARTRLLVRDREDLLRLRPQPAGVSSTPQASSPSAAARPCRGAAGGRGAPASGSSSDVGEAAHEELLDAAQMGVGGGAELRVAGARSASRTRRARPWRRCPSRRSRPARARRGAA